MLDFGSLILEKGGQGLTVVVVVIVTSSSSFRAPAASRDS